jgi:hypothetical protein
MVLPLNRLFCWLGRLGYYLAQCLDDWADRPERSKYEETIR